MYDFISGLIAFFSNQQVKVFTPTEFKKLTYNEIQPLLNSTLQSIGMKSYITNNFLLTNKGLGESSDEVYLHNCCKVTVGLHNPYNSLLVIKISGEEEILKQYHQSFVSSSQQLLENHGIILEVYAKQTEINNPQLIINQYVSPITDVFKTLRETMSYI
jgi:hypothetical protein